MKQRARRRTLVATANWTNNRPGGGVNSGFPRSAGGGFAQPASPLQSMASFSLLALLFLLYSRIGDGSLAFLHLPGIFLAIVVAFCVLRGAFRTAFSTKVGRFCLAFSIWLIIDIPFSVWRGGSWDVLVQGWLKNLLVF